MRRSAGRLSRLVAALIVFVFAASCSGTASPPSSTTTLATPTTVAPTSTSRPTESVTFTEAPIHEVGLFPVDPVTLTPTPGAAPITTGNWIWGSVSENGEWLVANVWVDTEPDTDAIRVIEVATGRVVTDVEGPLIHDLRIDDEGSVHAQIDGGSCGGRVDKLTVGSDTFETVFDAFPVGFCPWTSMELFDDRRAGWLGVLGFDTDEEQVALVVADLSDGTALTHPVPEVRMGVIGEEAMGEWVVSELLNPAVVWDAERNRALIVHADEPSVSVVDLTTGETSVETWSEPTSWIDSLLAWWIPPAYAKGPSLGVTKSSVLSPDGSTLYVATLESEMVTPAEGQPYVEAVPQAVEVIDTDTWTLETTLDVPASQVALTPDGAFLVATGVGMHETTSVSGYDPKGAFLFRTETLEQTGHEEIPGEFSDVQFSPDSAYLYLGRSGGGPIRIVELETGDEVGFVIGGSQQTVFGGASMLSTSIPQR